MRPSMGATEWGTRSVSDGEAGLAAAGTLARAPRPGARPWGLSLHRGRRGHKFRCASLHTLGYNMLIYEAMVRRVPKRHATSWMPALAPLAGRFGGAEAAADIAGTFAAGHPAAAPGPGGGVEIDFTTGSAPMPRPASAGWSRPGGPWNLSALHETGHPGQLAVDILA